MQKTPDHTHSNFPLESEKDRVFIAFKIQCLTGQVISYHINETYIPGVSLEAVITLQAGIGQIHKKQSCPNHNTHNTEETF